MNSWCHLCSTTDQESTPIVVVGSTISISVTVGYKIVPTTMVIFVTINLAWPGSLKGTAFKLGDKCEASFIKGGEGFCTTFCPGLT